MPEPTVVPTSARLASLRSAFPILQRSVNGCPLVYCDSAATSLTPLAVMEAEADFYRRLGGNVHRGSHALAVEASDAFEAARRDVATFLGARAQQVVFTSNATAALNLVAAGLPLRDDDEVLVSVNDHHAAILPWHRRGCLRWLPAPVHEAMTPELLVRALSPRTRAVVLTHASNVTGVVQPLAALCHALRERGVLSIVDAAQSAPHLALDVEALGCDFLALSGHKLLGPTGIGVLYGRDDALESLVPRDIGGGTVSRAGRDGFVWGALPGRLEPGTPHIAGALGLAAATRFLQDVGFHWLAAHGEALRERAHEQLAGQPHIRLLSSNRAGSLPMLTLALTNLPTTVDVVAATLSDRYGIMVRAGQHCAHPLFERLELRDGALRASFYLYNTLDEVEYVCASLREILSLYT
jgi:cysteine desulfurase/selenocysteine lyase